MGTILTSSSKSRLALNLANSLFDFPPQAIQFLDVYICIIMYYVYVYVRMLSSFNDKIGDHYSFDLDLFSI